jgi:hypothetical protein
MIVMSFFILKKAIGHRSVVVSVGIHKEVWAGAGHQLPRTPP